MGFPAWGLRIIQRILLDLSIEPTPERYCFPKELSLSDHGNNQTVMRLNTPITHEEIIMSLYHEQYFPIFIKPPISSSDRKNQRKKSLTLLILCRAKWIDILHFAGPAWRRENYQAVRIRKMATWTKRTDSIQLKSSATEPGRLAFPWPALMNNRCSEPPEKQHIRGCK